MKLKITKSKKSLKNKKNLKKFRIFEKKSSGTSNILYIEEQILYNTIGGFMLQIKSIYKSYGNKDNRFPVLKDINLSFRENEFVAILGPSGSGKTTLLNILGGLDHYDSGDLVINGKSTKRFKDKDWDSYRNKSIGFIFQSYNLISHISILNNVEMCLTLRNISKSEAKRRATNALERVGLKDHIHKRPNQLSGGQMQRVAIARALVNDPDIILADEPTGALDSKTSTQIMDLIKEISQEKLVIMVTHNEELAEIYASRIIKLSDGEIVSDSNPYEAEKQEEAYVLPKTKMSFLTALGLSLNNIKTKKGRTLLTSFAASIGIIGISLVLALSNGFQIQIDNFEKNTLTQMPILIMQDGIDSSNMITVAENKKEEYPSDNKIKSQETVEGVTHKNKLDSGYLDYLSKLDPNYLSGKSYLRMTSLNTLIQNEGKISTLNSYALNPLPEDNNGNIDSLMRDNYDLLKGKYAEDANELMLIVNSYNEIPNWLYTSLGLKDNSTFEDVLNKEIKLVNNDDYYLEYNNIFISNSNLEEVYNNTNNETLKIVGILRGKKDNNFSSIVGSGLSYKNALMSNYIAKNKDSNIVKMQESVNYNVFSGQEFEEASDKDSMLAQLGGVDSPYTIYLYPKDFESKDKIIQYLNKYNEDKEADDKVIYTDYAKTVTELSSGIMNAITLVLIGFSSVSLIVSSIMISIITYISVLERTKEIGILRSLGARKKDISRVFNAETAIIGFTSGLMGVGIAYLLTFPINVLIKNATDLSNVARLSVMHAIIMVIISVIITVIGGLIPAKMASKKDPVEALRTE